VLPRAVTGVILLIMGLMVAYWWMDSGCAQLGQEIRRCEQKSAALEDERVREEARWNEYNTPKKLKEMMLLHGIDMAYPTADQWVRMGADGQPVPKQLSLAKFKRGLGAGERVAKTQPK
jgi:hypothetical protein